MYRAPLVLLHGVGLDRTMWQLVIKRLAAAGREATALDLPGHGTERPLRIPGTLASYATDIADRLPAGPLHLVGFSLGALVAQAIALQQPERLASLTCVSGVCQRTAAESEAVRGRLQGAESDLAATFERSLERWYPEGTTASEADIEATRLTLAANDPESFVQSYRIFATADADLAARLGDITQPTLAITGELDPGSTPEMTHRLVAAVPHGQAHVVPGVRHMLPVEAPEILTDHLLTFINDVEGNPHV